MDVGWRGKVIAALGLKRSTAYYRHTQAELDAPLIEQIKNLPKEDKNYGYRRVAIALKIGKNRAQRLLRTYGLNPVPSLHQRHYKQHSGIREAPPNLLKVYCIFICRPNFIWACDFTYLWIPQLNRWYYLATVIDLYARDIVGWSLSIHHDAELITTTLYDALSGKRQPDILHFDRGSEYLSEAHMDLLGVLGIRPSASAKGSPWQNGYQERFYGSFKTELGSLKDITSEGELFELIAQTIHYYNSRRIHTKLKTNPHTHRQNYNKKKFIGFITLTGVVDKVSKNSGS